MLQKLFPPFVDKETGVPPNIYLGLALAVSLFVPMLIDYLF